MRKILLLGFFSAAAGCDAGNSDRAFARGEGADRAEPAVPVAVAAAIVGPISNYCTAPATLEVEKEAEILARATGIVETIAVEEGDMVEEDASLLTIENEEYRFRLGQAESNTRNLRAKLDRLEESKELASAEQLDAARNSYETAKAEEDLARLSLSYTEVRAPFKGRIIRRSVDIGRYVNIGAPLFAIADFDPLLARAHVPAKQLGRIQVDQSVELVLDTTGERLEGRIKLVSPTIDAKTGTIKITVEIPRYPAGTRPGDFAVVNIVTERRETATLVPASAVITDKGEQVVYVAALHIAERRVVEIGFKDETRAEILSGVTAGERVVVKGQRSLKHGSQLKVVEDGPAPAAGAAGMGS